MNEKTKRIRFTQFRFVVAGILLLAAGLKAWQLATSPLPPVAQDSVFTPLLELLNNRYLLMAVVVGEILFALVLIAGIWKHWTWLLSILAFTAFTLVSLMKGLSGESSCGCFGMVTVNPWITTCFDLVIVVLLTVFREWIEWTFPPLDRKSVAPVLVIWLVLAGSVLFAMLSLKEQPQTVLGTEFAGLDSKKTILLEPKDWIGKEFPLFSRFSEPNDSETLRHGEWTVLLIHTDCPDCRQMMADWEKQNAENVAVVVVPSQSNERIPNTNFPVFMLDNRNEWFVETPCVVKLSEGICIETVVYAGKSAIGEDREAIEGDDGKVVCSKIWPITRSGVKEKAIAKQNESSLDGSVRCESNEDYETHCVVCKVGDSTPGSPRQKYECPEDNGG